MGLKTNRNVRRSPQDCKNRPVLFVDVDGVISLFGFNPSDQVPGSFHSIDGIIHCIGHDAAGRLARLESRFELVWATGWEEKANEYLVHILEMAGELPVLTFDGRARFGTAHWKLEALDEYAGSRPLAWIDDSLDPSCYEWADERPTPTLLVPTEPDVGLLDLHVEALEGWVAAGFQPA